MRRCAHVLAILLTVSLLPALGAASPAAGATTGHITSLTADAGPIAVDGLTGHKDAVISLVATDDRGAIGACAAQDFYGWNLIQVWLHRTVRPHDTVSTYLSHTSTGLDGEHWSGTWRIGSTRNGTWVITMVRWCVGHTDTLVAPRATGFTSTITVVGTHIPHVTYAYVPPVAPYLGRQWLVATYRDGYGKPLARYPIVYGQDDQYDPPGKSVLLTDSKGRATVRVVRVAMQCLYFANPGTVSSPSTLLDFYRLTGTMYFQSVTAAVTPTVVRLGRSVTITGTVSPNNHAPVALQRLVGRTWRDVNLGVQRPSGHVTFTYPATTLGPVYLRIIARQPPATIEFFAPTPSRTLLVTVVR